MSVFFMFHSFQDNPRDIFQNCFIVTGRWHVLKHGNKIKANLMLVPSVGSTLSLPHQINFPFMIFPLQWLFISKTMIQAAMWKCLEYSLMILANFYSAWSDRREAEVTALLVSPSIIGDHNIHNPLPGADTGDWRESPSSHVNIRAKIIVNS